MSDDKDQEISKVLQRPFLPNEIGKLPRGGIQLDYVGHADVTRRLLEADPDWNWEPRARDADPEILAAALGTGNPEIVRQVLDNAPPKFDLSQNGRPVGLWIKLTVGGVTRLGYGSVPANQNDAEKVLIGDALRNAAMRFGVALDLWAKGDRAYPAAENPAGSGGEAHRERRPAPRGPAAGNGRPQTVRPAETPQDATAASEPDPEAQPFADEASECRTLAALKDVNTRAREARKLAALIRNPAGGGTGGLGQYIAWKKSALERAENALAALEDAGAHLGLSRAELDDEFAKQSGKSIEDATAEDLEKVTASLSAITAPAGV